MPYLPVSKVRKMTKLAFSGSSAKSVNKEALFTIIKASEQLLTMLSEQSALAARKSKRKAKTEYDHILQAILKIGEKPAKAKAKAMSGAKKRRTVARNVDLESLFGIHFLFDRHSLPNLKLRTQIPSENITRRISYILMKSQNEL